MKIIRLFAKSTNMENVSKTTSRRSASSWKLENSARKPHPKTLTPLPLSSLQKKWSGSDLKMVAPKMEGTMKKKTRFWRWTIASVVFRLILVYFPKNLNLSSRPEVSTPLTSLRRCNPNPLPPLSKILSLSLYIYVFRFSWINL